jgi:hypothetical protein
MSDKEYKVDFQDYYGDNGVFYLMLDPRNWELFKELLDNGKDPQEAFEEIFERS